jgi:hypothetical protein
MCKVWRKPWISVFNVGLGTLVTGALGLGGGALTACSDNPYDPGAPAIDPNAPRVHITGPARGTFAGDVRTLVVSGTVVDDVGVASLQVNGVDASVAGDGTWTATIPVGTGTQLIQAVAKDRDGNIGKESRAVVVGPLQPIEMAVPQAITVAMSAQTFDALGRGVTGFLENGQLAAAIAPSNPVLSVNGGPDCLYAQASVTSVAVGADTTVSLVPQRGGVALDVELDRARVGMHLQYAVACLDGSRDIVIAASRIRITGTLNAGISNGGFDVALADQHVQITGFDVDLGGVPGKIVDLLHLDEAVLGPIVGIAIEKLVVPTLNGALTQLNDVNSVDVLGTSVEIKLVPRRLSFDVDGAIVELDSSLRARADAGSPGYVYVANELPETAADAGFQLAIADDAANQLLASYWAAQGMNLGFDLTTGSYGNLGTLYDRIELSAKVPPFIDASGTTLVLTIGDLVATFKRGNAVATQVAINAQLRVRVTTGDDGVPRLDVGNPTTYVDVLDENIDGANPLSNAQFEAITSFALSRVIAVGSGTVGAIPLPSFGGVAVRDLEIAEQTGYLMVAGNIQ